MTAFTVTHRAGHRPPDLRPAGRARQQAEPGGGRRVRAALLRAAGRRTPLIRAVVLISGKPDSFIAGADIDQFLLIQEPRPKGPRWDRAGQDLINRVEALPQAGGRRHSRRLPRRRTRAGPRLHLADRHRSSRRPSWACPRCSSASCPGPAAASACPALSGCAPRWTSSSPARASGRQKAFKPRHGGRAGASRDPPRGRGRGRAPAGVGRGAAAPPNAGCRARCSTGTRSAGGSSIARRGRRCSRRPAATTRRHSRPSRR